uniref:SART-1 family protein n=1 Tax=Chromera velia CCMP2878 TaxID=1169474 RepID=A0A0G4I764_9ALVE|eukprot:Cvel_11594.t1-p1 / transcript=Cvel_11594.t1 / gene=Cvel_11594 / organism=Chromera_velia_CCMP2878 / gene_product=hypothetical protein / transcript_product=hypothetical protein / location=Cvel_scaffold733:59992-65514(+) / protein_length=691 / sequence_SO=supercontig / SO=protein_coding / is_pseudo=false
MSSEADAAAWVAAMRKKDAEKGGPTVSASAAAASVKKPLAALYYSDDEDSDDDAGRGRGGGRFAEDHLGGLRVTHKMKDLQGGDDSFLTLADKPILDEQGNLDMEGDELEDVHIAEREKRKEREREAKGRYNANADYEEEDEEEILKKKDILHHYDKWADPKAAAREKGFVLSKGGTAKAGADRNPLREGEVDLEVKWKVQSDFLPSSSLSKQKAEKGFRKKKTKGVKQERPRALKEEDDDLGEDILSFLSKQKGGKEEGDDVDMGTREDRKGEDSEVRASQVVQGVSQIQKGQWGVSVRAGGTGELKRVRAGGEGEEEETLGFGQAEDDEDQIFFEQMRKLRKVGALKEKEEPGEGGERNGGAEEKEKKREEALLESLRKIKPEKTEGGVDAHGDMKMGDGDEDDAMKIGDAVDGTSLQLSSTDQFVKVVMTPLEKLQASKNEAFSGAAVLEQQQQARERRLASKLKGQAEKEKEKEGGVKIGRRTEGTGIRRAYGGDDEEVEGVAVRGVERERRGGGEEEDAVMESMEGAAGRREGLALGEDDSDSESEEEHGMGEKTLDLGIAGTLERLKARGELELEDQLKKKRHEVGANVLHKDVDDEINFEYKDQFGNVQTPMEHFKQLSHVFHGKKPGKNKEEAYLRKKEQNKRTLIANTDMHFSKTASQQALERAKQQTGQAYMVLTGQRTKD